MPDVTGKKTEFKTALLQAAAEARSAGEIDRGDYLRIWFVATFRPRALAQVQATVVHEAVSAGLMPPSANPEAFDWSALLAFIQALLPIILQIISIFGGL